MFLNNSSAETYEDCWRKGFWSREYIGLGGPGGIETHWTNENLVFGQLIHAILAQLYAGRSVNNAIKLGVWEIRGLLKFDQLDYEEQNKWQENFEWAGRLMEAYDVWREDVDDFQPLQIESEGCVVLGEICYDCGAEYPNAYLEENPTALHKCINCGAEVHHWVFRTDLVIADGNYVEVLDHKTTKGASATFIESWERNFQMYGYAYGYEKATGMPVSGYRMNIIRKLKTVGTPQQTTKQCPVCRNGKHKVQWCENCNHTGRVERENNPSDQPFIRPDTYEWTEKKKELFVLQRQITIRRIMHERAVFDVNPEEAWPMNTKACYNMGRCPFIKLCFDGDAVKWYEPGDLLLGDTYRPRPEDYVSVRKMALEEAK